MKSTEIIPKILNRLSQKVMDKSNNIDQTNQTKLTAIHKLTMECVGSESKQNLIFLILNKSIELCWYNRAILWNISAKKPKPLGVSGTAELNPRSETLHHAARFLESLPDIDKSQLISEGSQATDGARHWSSLDRGVKGLEVLWLPLSPWGNPTVGLWLERWEGLRWQADEVKVFEQLAVSHKFAWERLVPRTFFARLRQRFLANTIIILVVGLLLALLILVKVPLRIIAPCEVVPKDPVVVTAPLDGVIEKVVVPAYQLVKNGDLLVVYDKRDVEEKLKLAEQQVRIIIHELERVRVQAMSDAELRSEIEILEGRLEQEKIRMELAQYHASKLEIRADSDGVAVIDNPDEWRGRPVVVGERILTIIVPSEVELRIWLPVDDNIAFDQKEPVKVVLNVNPDSGKKAILKYIGQNVTSGPTKIPVIMARADFLSVDQGLKSGMQGTAVLYGEKVRLVYWLFRKPLYTVRKITGV